MADTDVEEAKRKARADYINSLKQMKDDELPKTVIVKLTTVMARHLIEDIISGVGDSFSGVATVWAEKYLETRYKPSAPDIDVDAIVKQIDDATTLIEDQKQTINHLKDQVARLQKEVTTAHANQSRQDGAVLISHHRTGGVG